MFLKRPIPHYIAQGNDCFGIFHKPGEIAMKRLAAFTGLVLLLTATVALANGNTAGPDPTGGRFAGVWKGYGPLRYINQCGGMEFQLTVSGNKVSGKMLGPAFNSNISGTIAADGSMTTNSGGTFMSGRFEGDHFFGSFDSNQASIALVGCSFGLALDRVK